MRQFHPFPIFERWADKDVTEATVLEMCNGNRHSSNLSSSQKSLNSSQKNYHHGNDGDEDNVVSSSFSSEMRDNDDGDNGGGDRVLVPANTHCIMFTSGFFYHCICGISFCCASSIFISPSLHTISLLQYDTPTLTTHRHTDTPSLLEFPFSHVPLPLSTPHCLCFIH